MDRLWTWFPTGRRGSYSPAEPETPNVNGAKEKITGKKKWRNIFSRDRKPKDAGKLLKEEALEGQVPQKKEKKKWKNIFSRNRKPKDAGKLLKEEALEGQVPQPGVLELHADTEAGALKNTSLHETRGDTEMLLPVKELEPDAEALTNTSMDETRGDTEMLLPVRELKAEPEVPTNTSLDDTRGNAEMLLPVRELEAEPEALKVLIKTSLVESEETELQNKEDTEADLFSKDDGITGEHGRRKKIRRGTRGRGRKIIYKKKDNNGSEIINKVNVEAEAKVLTNTSLVETRDNAEMLLPIRELEAEPEVLTNTSLVETRDNAEMLLPIRELEAEPEVLTNTSLVETRDNAEMLLPIRELEAEPEVLTNTSLVETRDNAEMLLPIRELEAEPEVLTNTSLVETRDNAEMLLPIRELEAEPEVLTNTSLVETRDNAEMLLPIRELEAEPEVLTNTSLVETRDNAEMLLTVRELEAEPEALKDPIKTSLDESEETELQNREDTEADLFSKDDGITGEHGRRKKIRRGTRGRGRKIIYKKKDNNGSDIINEVNAEAEAEAEVAKMKNVHLDEKDSSADLLNPDQTLGEERNQWIGRGNPEDGMKQKKKIRRGTRGRGRKIIYKKDASKTEASAAGFNHQTIDYVLCVH
ncbi:myosin-10-like [Trichomycterus rosablanca]|uniref:myosin-10-like n=1 Tax=Trichomycterus rosablanca TaxID=2290929 RepID=UPI002F353B30